MWPSDKSRSCPQPILFLDSVFFPASFIVCTHSFDIGENSTLEAPGLSKLAASEGEFSLGIHIIP